jgi:hypothetical protein
MVASNTATVPPKVMKRSNPLSLHHSQRERRGLMGLGIDLAIFLNPDAELKPETQQLGHLSQRRNGPIQ